MTKSLRDRPAAHRADNGGRPARRAVIRWAWRLFRHEWRQQLLVLALLAVAVAATTVGVALVANAPSSPDATFGTANTMLTLTGPDRYFAADIADVRKAFGVIDVIEHQDVRIPGSINTVDLRAQSPDGRFGYPMLRLDAGRYPTGPDQVAITTGVAAIYRLRIGDVWHEDGRARRVVGLVENPQNLLDNFALVAPGQASPPTQVQILVDATTAKLAGYSARGGFGLEPRPPVQQGFPAIAVLLFAAIGLLFVGLVAVAGFTVMLHRRLRALGMLGALGATNRHVRLVLLANGAVVGTVGAIAGAALGLAGWVAFVPRLEKLAEHRIDVFNVPWWDIGAAMALAAGTAVAAAWWPARTAARMPVVASLSGRPPRPQPSHRLAAASGVFLAAGLGMLALSREGHSPGLTLGGLVATVFGTLLLAPLAIRALSAAARRSPIAVRLALRDLARYQARSGAALAAIGLTLGITAAIAINAAAAQAAAGVPPTSGNLPPNQLMVYLSANADYSLGNGGPIPEPTAAQVRVEQASVSSFAATLHARTPLALDAAVSPKAPSAPTGHGSGVIGQGGQGKPAAALAKATHVTVNGRSGYAFSPPSHSGLLYVATPAVLTNYGIKPGSVDPAADILTSHTGLGGYGIMDFAGQSPCPGGAANCVVHRHSAPRSLPRPEGIWDPKVERVDLPGYTSDPNTLITAHAVQALGLRLVPVGWLIQAPKALTAAQVAAADHWAAAAGLTVETRSEPASPDLSLLATEATAVGALIALGVLAMTIGLIRSETASDLRTLTATGASGRTRRNVTAATAGALALLGALLGTVGAYLAIVAFHRGVQDISNLTPVADLGVIVVGLPLAAAICGWLLAGREPAGITRKPLQ